MENLVRCRSFLASQVWSQLQEILDACHTSQKLNELEEVITVIHCYLLSLKEIREGGLTPNIVSDIDSKHRSIPCYSTGAKMQNNNSYINVLFKN